MLHTKRLAIREITAADLHAIHALNSLPETDEYNTLGIPASISVSEQLLNEWLSAKKQAPRNYYVLGIDKNDDHKFIGLVAISLARPKYRRAEVWFKIHKDFWRQGYMTEALEKVLDFGFNTLQLHRIEAGCATGNLASARVLEKCGMTREGIQRKNLPIRGGWIDNYCYGILEEEFKKV